MRLLPVFIAGFVILLGGGQSRADAPQQSLAVATLADPEHSAPSTPADAPVAQPAPAADAESTNRTTASSAEDAAATPAAQSEAEAAATADAETAAASASTESDAAAAAPEEAAKPKPAKLREGYKMVEKDGQRYYCYKKHTTGSRLRPVQECLSATQYEAKHHETPVVGDGTPTSTDAARTSTDPQPQ